MKAIEGVRWAQSKSRASSNSLVFLSIERHGKLFSHKNRMYSSRQWPCETLGYEFCPTLAIDYMLIRYM